MEGADDPGACDYWGGGTTDFELALYDDSGRLAVREYAPCEDFGMTIEGVRTGYYTAEVTLVVPGTLDPLTTTLPLEDVRIRRDTELELDVDFPPSSFLE